MVKKKSKSKRVSMHKKYMIKKKTREHYRKARKSSNRALINVKRKAKDIGIPNSWPFKADLLDQIEVAKKTFEDKQSLIKEKRIEEKVFLEGIFCLSFFVCSKRQIGS